MCIAKAVGIVTRHTLNSYIHIRIEKDLGHSRYILSRYTSASDNISGCEVTRHYILYKHLPSLIIVAKYVC